MAGANPYDNRMEGVLEQRSEDSSIRRKIPPLKGMWYKTGHSPYHKSADFRSEIRWNRGNIRPKYMQHILRAIFMRTGT